eukprot:CAMPEP_0113614940 /NCGR_PEP_ID=MMETSP0017_2-20120614/7434_1 /TAXON_ID=2856 /ORGANISM="Cylindrotheca closterium" /LENGTH=95 /DNA_ID=CAMNT_0000524141 /DNA_START=16 /DNA_END=299 /DNA_ORIENTATION=- /assembly_acc=CAM_ASM_000147
MVASSLLELLPRETWMVGCPVSLTTTPVVTAGPFGWLATIAVLAWIVKSLAPKDLRKVSSPLTWTSYETPSKVMMCGSPQPTALHTGQTPSAGGV